jgi:hypothetical protein
MDKETIQKVIPSKGTRLKWLMTLTVMATAAWVLSLTGTIEQSQAVSFVEWADFEKWLFMAYGATEVGDKYSHAVMNK